MTLDIKPFKDLCKYGYVLSSLQLGNAFHEFRFLVLSLSVLTPNKFRMAGSQRKMGLIFSSGQKIRTRDSWVESANATSVLCPQLDFVNSDFFSCALWGCQAGVKPLTLFHPPTTGHEVFLLLFRKQQMTAEAILLISSLGFLGIFWSKAVCGCKKGPESAEPDLGVFFYSIRFDFRPNICGCFCFFQASRSFR